MIAISAAAIRLIDPGPVLFRQRRIGENGRMIEVLKLRTMYVDAEALLQRHLAANPDALAEWQRTYKLAQDPRILPVIGSFLRRSSIDELPQIWNVLKGEMSLVGPRPLPPYHLDAFSEQFRTLRQQVPPGITGLWQTSVRSDGDLRALERYDSYYIRNWSIWLDLYVLCATIWAVLGGKGAR